MKKKNVTKRVSEKITLDKMILINVIKRQDKLIQKLNKTIKEQGDCIHKLIESYKNMEVVRELMDK